MPIDQKLIRVERPDDPRRCQASVVNQQCPYQAIESSTFCHMHTPGTQDKIKKEMVRNYQLTQWKSRVDQFADSDSAKSLREEIGIARLVLENILGICKDSHDLILYSAKISDMVMKIEKLVVSCNRLESNLGMLLDKTAAINLASQIVAIISEEVPDDLLIEKIGRRIVESILLTKEG
jgi:hypothetical protein